MPKPGFYAVRKGRKRGIFYSWDDCKAQVGGYSGAQHKKFKTEEEAENYLEQILNETVITKIHPATDSGVFTSPIRSVHRTEKTSAERNEFFRSIDSTCAIKDDEVEKNLSLSHQPSKEPVVLSSEQYRCILQVLTGHNVFLSGSAGTGKSFLVRLLKEIYLARKQRVLAITASTGCAACGIKGQTIHAWAGVGTGLGSDLSAEDLLCKVGKHNRKNWKETDVLLIDEISMISAKELDKLSELACLVRDNFEQPFGGLQIVLCGDFLQLPPVSKPEAPASFCFESKVWKLLFHNSYENMIILSKIQRQKEPIFQRILNSLRFGMVTPEADWFLRRKSAPPTTTSKSLDESSSSPWFTNRKEGGSSHSVKLFSRLSDVNRVNDLFLESLPSNETIDIPSMDSKLDALTTDEIKALRIRLNQETPAQPILHFKVGAQVMLIANLDTRIGLVNGARGRIVGFRNKIDEETQMEVTLPIVRFAIESSNLSGAEEEMKRFKSGMDTRLPSTNKGYKIFTQMGYEPWNGLGKDGTGPSDPIEASLANQRSLGFMSHNINDTVERVLEYYPFHLKNNYEKVLATRKQVPLILAYALTIHKTQGMSLPNIEVNMDGIFSSGQAYVALSRATSAAGLKITGYNKPLIFSNPSALKFYKSIIDQRNEQEERVMFSSDAMVTTSVYELSNM